MLANDSRFRRKSQIFQKIRAYFRVMEIYAHFFCQQAFTAIAAGTSAFWKQGRKKDGNRFPYRAEISFFPSDIVQQRTARQKCGIDRLRKLAHQHLRASRRTNRMTLVRNGHLEKQPPKRRNERTFHIFSVARGNPRKCRQKKLPHSSYHHSK